MNRKMMVDEIVLMADDMKPELIEMKVKECHLHIPYEATDFPKDMIQEGYKWLLHIWQNEFAAVRTVRNLLTEDQWSRYKLWESFSRTQEMKLLKEKQVPFRKAITNKNRPDLFKKGKQDVEIKTINSKKGS